MSRRKTNAEFKRDLYKIHGHAIIPLEKYKNSYTKIRFKCRRCGFIWRACPSDLYRNSGCPRCSVHNRCKTNAEFKKDLYKVYGNAIIPLKNYKNTHTKMQVKCRRCGFVWKAYPNELYHGFGCPRCASRNQHNHRKTDAEFKRDLYKAHGNTIIPLENYKNAHTKIKVKCRRCGFIWQAYPNGLLHGFGCPRCNPHNRRKTNTKFKRGLYKAHGNAIIPLEKYKNCHTKIKVKCRRCGLIWKALPPNLCRGTGCPRCAVRIRSIKEKSN